GDGQTVEEAGALVTNIERWHSRDAQLRLQVDATSGEEVVRAQRRVDDAVDLLRIHPGPLERYVRRLQREIGTGLLPGLYPVALLDAAPLPDPFIRRVPPLAELVVRQHPFGYVKPCTDELGAKHPTPPSGGSGMDVTSRSVPCPGARHARVPGTGHCAVRLTVPHSTGESMRGARPARHRFSQYDTFTRKVLSGCRVHQTAVVAPPRLPVHVVLERLASVRPYHVHGRTRQVLPSQHGIRAQLREAERRARLPRFG